MPQRLHLEPDTDSPDLTLDAEKNIFNISGISVVEDALEFYTPVLKWFDDYMRSPNLKTTLVIKLKYFNTSSAELILYIFDKLKMIQDKGKEVLVSWHYHINDSDMKEAGEDYAELVELPFEFISYEN